MISFAAKELQVSFAYIVPHHNKAVSRRFTFREGPGLQTNVFHHRPGTDPENNFNHPKVNANRPRD